MIAEMVVSEMQNGSIVPVAVESRIEFRSHLIQLSMPDHRDRASHIEE